ncbi:hypothetical protein Esti_001260 [Eimeria stiedai]
MDLLIAAGWLLLLFAAAVAASSSPEHAEGSQEVPAQTESKADSQLSSHNLLQDIKDILAPLDNNMHVLRPLAKEVLAVASEKLKRFPKVSQKIERLKKLVGNAPSKED